VHHPNYDTTASCFVLCFFICRRGLGFKMKSSKIQNHNHNVIDPSLGLALNLALSVPVGEVACEAAMRHGFVVCSLASMVHHRINQ
jgi:hypothetical protein